MDILFFGLAGAGGVEPLVNHLPYFMTTGLESASRINAYKSQHREKIVLSFFGFFYRKRSNLALRIDIGAGYENRTRVSDLANQRISPYAKPAILFWL